MRARTQVRDGLSIEVPQALERTFTDFEPCTTDIIVEHLKPGAVFLDVGANFGYFSVLAASIVGPKGRVYAVEASPAVEPLLRDNLAPFPQATVITSAVGDRTGETVFHLTADFVNSGVAPSPFIGETQEITLPIDTLDRLLPRQPDFDGRIDVIKCDVQGDEFAVLAGLRQTIAANPSLRLIVEWAPAWMNNAGFDATALPDVLQGLGFTGLLVVDDYLRKTMSVEEMQAEFQRDLTGKRFCNLMAWK